jgi:hypothetical protein
VKGRGAKGLAVSGRVALRGGGAIFSDTLSVEGVAVPQQANPPNISCEFWGGEGSYAVIFGIGFEDEKLAPVDLKGQPIVSPSDVVLVRPPGGGTWYALASEYDEKTKVVRGRRCGFTFSDGEGTLTMEIHGRKPIGIPRTIIERDLPAMGGAKGSGTIVIDTRSSPVLFERLTVKGARSADWLREFRVGEARAELEALFGSPVSP